MAARKRLRRPPKNQQAEVLLRRLRLVRARLDHRVNPRRSRPTRTSSRRSIPFQAESAHILGRVTNNGAGAVFKLVSPPILHGTGICLPSTSECQTIDLEPGHSEELEYIEASGQIVVYELKVVSIVKGDGASAASLKHKDAGAARVRRKAHSK